MNQITKEENYGKQIGIMQLFKRLKQFNKFIMMQNDKLEFVEYHFQLMLTLFKPSINFENIGN